LLRLFSKVRACSFRCSSFSAKGRVRVACSLVNALTTALAHYQPFAGAGTQGSCVFFVVPYHVGAKSALLRLIFCKNKPSARSLAPPFRKKSRSAHLFGCKRPHNGSLSLPTFCELRELHSISQNRGFFAKPPVRSFRSVSFPKKVTLRLR